MCAPTALSAEGNPCGQSPARPLSHWRMWAGAQALADKGTTVPPVHETGQAQSSGGTGKGAGCGLLGAVEARAEMDPAGCPAPCNTDLILVCFVNTVYPGCPPPSRENLRKTALLAADPSVSLPVCPKPLCWRLVTMDEVRQ